MPICGTDTDEDDTGTSTFGGASISGTRQVTQPPIPADLRTVLAPTTTFGTKLFEITVVITVATNCKLNVKDAGVIITFCSFVGPLTCGSSKQNCSRRGGTREEPLL
jgi:hypothetical protein